MNLMKIKNTDKKTKEVNLDCLGAIEESEYSNEITLCFGGYFVTVDQDEYKRIRERLDEVSKTDAPIDKIKEAIYRAAYLNSDAKLQLIMQLENIE